MSAANAARTASRRAAVAHSHACTRAMRRFSAAPPPPLPEERGSNMPLILGFLLAAGGAGGYYYLNQTGKEEDVALKARELDHAARVQANKKIEEGKGKFDEAKASTSYADANAKIDAARSSIQSSYNKTIDSASQVAHDAQARLNEYKDSASSSIHNAKESTVQAAEDAKAKSSGWFLGWFSWGKGKAQDAKSEAAHDTAAGFRTVKEEAKKGERAAEKRT